jgi:dCMP deaminase
MATHGPASKWDKRMLVLADHIRSWSQDPTTRVGAVIADQHNRVVSMGVNGFPRGIDDDDRLHERNIKHDITMHAELNAILFAGRELHACTLYCTHEPCMRCAAAIIQVGIRRVFYLDNSAIMVHDGATLMREAGVECSKMDKPHG